MTKKISLLHTLARATAGIDTDLLAKDFDASPYLTEEGEDYDTLEFDSDEIGLLVKVGDVECVSDFGYSPKTGAFMAIVAKKDADTARISAKLPDDCVRIASIRPGPMGQMFISGDMVTALASDERLGKGLRQLFAAGFIPTEGVSFRHNIKSHYLTTVVLDVETAKMAVVMLGETQMHFCAFVSGRLLVATERAVILTKRVSAAMLQTIVERGSIPKAFLHEGSRVRLRAAPTTIVTNGASTIFGLQDGSNIAIRVEPDGTIKVDGTDSATGRLLSLFTRVAERDTQTAIAERNGQMTRVPIASLPSGFRHTAGIAVGNGNGRGHDRAN